MSFNPWRPPRLKPVHQQHGPDKAWEELDTSIGRIVDSHNDLRSRALTGADGANTVKQGTTTVKGSKLAVSTGLNSVNNVTGVIDSAGTPFNEWLTVLPSKTQVGAIDIYIFKPTSSGNNTPIASTTSWTVRWTATGA